MESREIREIISTTHRGVKGGRGKDPNLFFFFCQVECALAKGGNRPKLLILDDWHRNESAESSSTSTSLLSKIIHSREDGVPLPSDVLIPLRSEDDVGHLLSLSSKPSSWKKEFTIEIEFPPFLYLLPQNSFSCFPQFF